jgi:hypothetical protein
VEINVLHNVGGGLVGATAGLWIGAVTGAARPAARAAWWAELGVGAAALAGGLTWNILETNKFDAAIAADEKASFLGPLLAAEVAGLGAGLIGGAIPGLVIESRLRGGKPSGLAWTLTPSASPRLIGAMFSANF